MKRALEILALQNAVKFGGKANPGAVLGGILGQHPEKRSEAKAIMQEVQAVCKSVNSLSAEAQEKRLRELAPDSFEKKEKKKRELPELEHTEAGVVTRIPPEPSKYPHVGHALSFLINYMYAKKYKGKCVLRLEDTNPRKAEPEYYQAVYDALKWLKIEPDETMIMSKHMDDFYKYAVQLIEKERAYVCSCDREKVSEYRTKAMICTHRRQSPRHNVVEWEKMLDGSYKEGEVTLRLVGEIDATNAVMRDPVLFRIVDHPHPLTKDKYRVWPLYDFAVVVAEELSKVTLVLRSNEFGRMRIELQNYIKDLLNFNRQTIRQYGRFNITGAVTQGREIRAMIEKEEVQGWHDPRLVTTLALERRGIQPETMYELAVEAGLSSNQSNIDWSVIASINRKLIDPVTKRYFFVKDPKTVTVENDVREAVVPLHPENDELGVKHVKVGKEFYVADEIEAGKTYRFMHLFNFKDAQFVSEAYDAALKAKIIHAVPVEGAIDVQVLMDDGSYVRGKGEKALASLKQGDVVQFERMFFCRLDDKEKMLFVYAHD